MVFFDPIHLEYVSVTRFLGTPFATHCGHHTRMAPKVKEELADRVLLGKQSAAAREDEQCDKGRDALQMRWEREEMIRAEFYDELG